jgi:hypothetical protein
MVSKVDFPAATRRAVLNVLKHGDTDIFQFRSKLMPSSTDMKIYVTMWWNITIVAYPPDIVSLLYPVTYSGFRYFGGRPKSDAAVWLSDFDRIRRRFALFTLCKDNLRNSMYNS